MIFIFIFVVSIAILVAIIKKIFGKKKPIPTVAPVIAEKILETPAIEKNISEEKKKKSCSCGLIVAVLILFLIIIVAFYLVGNSHS